MDEIVSKDKEQEKEWRYTVEKDSMTKNISVRKISNGFLVTKSVYGYKKDEEGEEKYIDKRKEFYSKDNPLDKESKSEDKEEDLMSSVEDLMSNYGMLSD